jgi:hypothetical protein
MPQEIGDAQKELRIQKEATYIITVINLNKPVPEDYPTAEAKRPRYLEDIEKYLNNSQEKIHFIITKFKPYKLSKCSGSTSRSQRRKRYNKTGNRFGD